MLLLLLLLAIALGAFVWSLLAGREPAPPAQPDAAVGEVAGRSAQVAAAPAPLAHDSVDRTLASPGTSAPVPARALVATDILVVEQVSGEPVAGADVVWDDNSNAARFAGLARTEQLRWERDPEAKARQFGAHTTTDAKGRARVLHTSQGALVFARRGDLYGGVGWQAGPAPPGGYRIELAADRLLRVQVLDAQGEPAAEVPLEIAQHATDGRFLRIWQPNWQPVTEAPDGIARAVHLQEWAANGALRNLPGTLGSWRVRLGLPGFVDEGVAFDPDAPPASPLVLRMPPTGRVAVRAMFGGQPLQGLVWVRLTAEQQVGALDASAPWTRLVDDDGWVHFPCVPLGKSLLAEGFLGCALRQTFAGPTAEGQEVRVELVPEDDAVLLAGRLVDAQGQALAETEVPAEFAVAGMTGGHLVRTDARGHFVWCVGKAMDGRASLDKLVLSQQLPGQPRIRCAVSPRELRMGKNDLGDLQLVPGTIVCAGTFVFDPGQRPTLGWTVEQAGPGGDIAAASWRVVEGLSQEMSADGRFAVTGSVSGGRCRLVFLARDHLPVAPVEFTPGATGLVIRIESGHDLLLTTKLSGAAPWGLFGVLRNSAAVPERGDPRSSMDWRRNGERNLLRWHAVASGTYTLELRTWGCGEPILAIADVVLPGPAGGDPRLCDVDLRERLRVVTLRQRRPTFDVVVFPMPQDLATSWCGYEGYGPDILVPVPSGPVELLALSKGWQPKLLRVVQDAVDIELEPWPEVQLAVVGLPPLPPGTTVMAALRPPSPSADGGFQLQVGGSGSRGELMRPPVVAGALIDCRVSLPIGEGAHRLVLSVHHDGGATVPLRHEQPTEIFAGPGVVEVRITEEAMQEVGLGRKEPKGR